MLPLILGAHSLLFGLTDLMLAGEGILRKTYDPAPVEFEGVTFTQQSTIELRAALTP